MIVPALTAVPAAALIAVHLFAGHGPLRTLKRGAWLSFSGGAAAAYVFLYLLPILNDMFYDLAARSRSAGRSAISASPICRRPASPSPSWRAA